MNLDTRITLLGLRAFNFLYDIGTFVGKFALQSISDFSAYMAGRYSIWHFLEGDVGPLPDCVVHNRSIANIQWTYNMSTYKLTHNHNHGLQVTSENPWLTAAIRMGNIEYDMDEFIRNFKWVSNINIYPSKKLLLNVWSIHSGIWLSREDNPILRVITHEGEQVDINIYDNDDDSWQRLLLGEDSDSESESDSSGHEADSDSSTESDSASEDSVSEESSDAESESEQQDTNMNDTLPSSNDTNDMSIVPSPILQATPTDRSRLESGDIVELNE